MTKAEAIELGTVLTHLLLRCNAIYEKCGSKLVDEIREDTLKKLYQISDIIREHQLLDKALEENEELWQEIKQTKPN